MPPSPAEEPPGEPRATPGANPYERFAEAELILRDQLAIDRTVLANERTFLAYCRTSLALAISGAGAVKFLESVALVAAGWALVVAGLVVAGIGLQRYRRMARSIACLGELPHQARRPEP